MSTQAETSSRDLVAALNDAALARTLATHPAILIRHAEITSWRPCRQDAVGVLEGLEHLGTLVPLCTDGCVAWFLRKLPVDETAGRNVRNADAPLPQVKEYPDTTLLHGHVGYFLWSDGKKRGAPPQPYSEKKETSSSSTPKAGKPRLPSPLSAALELLKQLQQENSSL